MSFFNKAYFFPPETNFVYVPTSQKKNPFRGFTSYHRFHVHLKLVLYWVQKASKKFKKVHMKSMIARENPQKAFSLGDYATHSKSVSGGKKALLKKLFFFLTAQVNMFHAG